MKNRLTDPSEICALDFKREFLRFGFCPVPAPIGIDRLVLNSREGSGSDRHGEIRAVPCTLPFRRIRRRVIGFDGLVSGR